MTHSEILELGLYDRLRSGAKETLTKEVVACPKTVMQLITALKGRHLYSALTVEQVRHLRLFTDITPETALEWEWGDCWFYTDEELLAKD